MERPAKSVLTKWSNESCRRANATARFFAQFRRNKYRKKLPREVGAISRRTNIDKDPAHGGKFGNSRDSTSGKVVLVQEKFQFIVCMSMHKKK